MGPEGRGRYADSVLAACPTGPGLVTRRVRARSEQVALIRYLLEAHDGLGALHGDGTAHITLFAPESQAAALDEVIADLMAEGLLGPAEPLTQ